MIHRIPQKTGPRERHSVPQVQAGLPGEAGMALDLLPCIVGADRFELSTPAL